MSVQTLYTAATGMQALETKLDVIAHNLANINTTAFKKGRANFEDLFYRHEVLPGTQDSSGEMTPTGTSIGLGARVNSVQTNFSQGAFQQTGRELDLAIVGRGFFRVTDPDGSTLYTRAGHLSINANGNLVVGSDNIGRLITPPIQVPENATGVVVNGDGSVFVRLPNNTELQRAGDLELATFINPEGLLKLGENLYSETQASGAAVPGAPGQNGFGSIRQNMLEASNVEPVQELIDLITTQRSFELNSQAIQAGDQILQVISNLGRL